MRLLEISTPSRVEGYVPDTPHGRAVADKVAALLLTTHPRVTVTPTDRSSQGARRYDR